MRRLHFVLACCLTVVSLAFAFGPAASAVCCEGGGGNCCGPCCWAGPDGCTAGPCKN